MPCAGAGCDDLQSADAAQLRHLAQLCQTANCPCFLLLGMKSADCSVNIIRVVRDGVNVSAEGRDRQPAHQTRRQSTRRIVQRGGSDVGFCCGRQPRLADGGYSSSASGRKLKASDSSSAKQRCAGERPRQSRALGKGASVSARASASRAKAQAGSRFLRAFFGSGGAMGEWRVGCGGKATLPPSRRSSARHPHPWRSRRTQLRLLRGWAVRSTHCQGVIGRPAGQGLVGRQGLSEGRPRMRRRAG